MSQIRFFTDEDVYGEVAPQLRAAGYDALSTPEAARLGQDDESQLMWAASAGSSLVTFNVGDFARLHHLWLRQGRHHCGVIVSQQRPLGEIIRRLLRLGRTRTADGMQDALEFLSNWSPD
jgi:hypothetical protein